MLLEVINNNKVTISHTYKLLVRNISKRLDHFQIGNKIIRFCGTVAICSHGGRTSWDQQTV